MTGGNAGVGYATAQALLARGCSVVLAVRDQGRGEAAAARLAASGASGGDGGSRQPSGGRRKSGGSTGKQQGGGAVSQDSPAAQQQPVEPPSEQPEAARVEVELLDLASLASVRAFAERWRASGRPLDLLVCNGERASS